MRKRSLLNDIDEEGSSRKKLSTSCGTRKLIPCFCNECKGAFRDPRIKKSHEAGISEKLQTDSDFTWNSDIDNSSVHSEEIPEVLSFATDNKLRYPRFLQPFVLIPSEGFNDNSNDIIS